MQCGLGYKDFKGSVIQKSEYYLVLHIYVKNTNTYTWTNRTGMNMRKKTIIM